MKLADQEKGFTLVEVLAGLAILAIILVAALPLFTSNLRQTVQNKQREQALRLAQERLEYFLHQQVQAGETQSGTETIGETAFSWNLQVKKPDSPSNLKVLQLKVTVTYQEQGTGTSRDLSLSVLKTE